LSQEERNVLIGVWLGHRRDHWLLAIPLHYQFAAVLVSNASRSGQRHVRMKSKLLHISSCIQFERATSYDGDHLWFGPQSAALQQLASAIQLP
jgi:hypothetical protein